MRFRLGPLQQAFTAMFEAAFIATMVFAWTTASGDDFKWDWRNSQELTGKQALRRAPVTKAERAAMVTVIAERLRAYMDNAASEQDLANIALDVRVKMVDLNGDGVPEVIIQGPPAACSPTGNCPIWVLQKTGGNYRVILQADTIQSFTVERNRTNGFNDIVVASHGSATDGGLTVFRYQNAEFHAAGWYEYSWAPSESAQRRKLEAPRVTPCAAR
jgi:hypothetical protein